MRHLDQVQQDSHLRVKARQIRRRLGRLTCTCHSEVDPNHDLRNPTIRAWGRHGEPLEYNRRGAPSVPLKY